jgi:UMF1 family MFS transporter
MGASEDGSSYSRREQTGWYIYDWANSAFYTSAVTMFLGPYLTALAKAAADEAGYVYPFRVPVDARSWWGYVVALSVALQVTVLPVIGALADYSRRKKQLLGVFAYTGAACTMAMYFLEGGAYLSGGLLFLAANVSFGASIVIYNSFLPEIASPAERDAVSSKGWGIGYLGGGLLLGLNLLLVQNADALGLTEAHAVRLSLWSAGAWWAGFTIFPLRRLRNRKAPRRLERGDRYLTAGFRQLAHTLRGLKNQPQGLKFLLAYLVYSDAIQAVIVLAAQFGNDELGIPISTLALAILMVQFVAFFGALGFNQVARVIGAKRAVMLSLAIWTGVLVSIYAWVATTAHFFAVAAVVALVLGGSQALSRSLFSLMIPKEKEAEYFSLYEIADRGTSWLAPLLFGLALQFTGSYRLAILSLILFFALGLALLARVDVRRAALEAGNEI